MSKFKQIFFGLVLLIGLAVGVSAQRGNDQKKPPPKPPPPTVNPGRGDKPPPKPKDEKPKKPGAGYSLVWRHEQKSVA